MVMMKTSASTPLPMRKIAIVSWIVLANNIGMWSLYSLLPFMVSTFYPKLLARELGWRSGFLAASYALGGLFGGIFFSFLSDNYGRRPVLLCSAICSSLLSLAFGFSPSFPVACLLRLIWGFCGQTIGVAKTTIAETLDDSNQGLYIYLCVPVIKHNLLIFVHGFFCVLFVA